MTIGLTEPIYYLCDKIACYATYNIISRRFIRRQHITNKVKRRKFGHHIQYRKELCRIY